MSIISSYEFDDSNMLYKEFAELTRSYVDNPTEPRTRVAQIPLENLYRLFEMFRYDAFSDDEHCGVLQIDPVYDTNLKSPPPWHTGIETALKTAFSSSFGNKPTDEAIDEIEDVLRLLSSNDKLPVAKQRTAKKFFTNFIQQLA